MPTSTGTRWVHDPEPKHISFPAHGSATVTCLLFSHGRIISAADDDTINVYSPETGELIQTLHGHEGGVWALASCGKDRLVSGSTDRTVRIWDLSRTGRSSSSSSCTHVFGGHDGTVRCLVIVKPEMVDVAERDGDSEVVKEKWPKRPLIVSGSRDCSLKVWTLPRLGGGGEGEGDKIWDVDENPYHRRDLEGHEGAIRAVDARGRMLVSGSYDCTVRVWDVITGECKWILTGHTQKVYSVVLDTTRKQAYSSSMDGTIRIWNVLTGQCQHTLTGHDSLVGLLGLSPSFLVSGGGDGMLRVWDPATGELEHTLVGHRDAITAFQHDEFKVVSGSGSGRLKVWNVRDGTLERELVMMMMMDSGPPIGVWKVVFRGRWCVVACRRGDETMVDVWEFETGKDDPCDDGDGDDSDFSEGEGEDEDEKEAAAGGDPVDAKE